MITEAIMKVLGGIASFVAGLMPSMSFPTYLTGSGPGTLNAQLQSTIAGIWSLDAWVPVSSLFAVGALVMGASAIALSIKLVRIVASFLTFGGGSAA